MIVGVALFYTLSQLQIYSPAILYHQELNLYSEERCLCLKCTIICRFESKCFCRDLFEDVKRSEGGINDTC